MGMLSFPLEVMVQNERERTERFIQEVREECEQHIRSIEQHRRICLDLCGVEGIRLEEYRFGLEIHLGERPRTKRGLREFGRKLKLLRDTLGHKLEPCGKYLQDDKKKLVRVHLRCEPYPDLNIFYVCKLSRNDRCKIVRRKTRETRSDLVCEI